MFDDLFNFKKERTPLQAFGFFAFYATVGLVVTSLFL